MERKRVNGYGALLLEAGVETESMNCLGIGGGGGGGGSSV